MFFNNKITKFLILFSLLIINYCNIIYNKEEEIYKLLSNCKRYSNITNNIYYEGIFIETKDNISYFKISNHINLLNLKNFNYKITISNLFIKGISNSTEKLLIKKKNILIFHERSSNLELSFQITKEEKNEMKNFIKNIKKKGDEFFIEIEINANIQKFKIFSIYFDIDINYLIVTNDLIKFNNGISYLKEFKKTNNLFYLKSCFIFFINTINSLNNFSIIIIKSTEISLKLRLEYLSLSLILLEKYNNNSLLSFNNYNLSFENVKTKEIFGIKYFTDLIINNLKNNNIKIYTVNENKNNITSYIHCLYINNNNNKLDFNSIKSIKFLEVRNNNVISIKINIINKLINKNILYEMKNKNINVSIKLIENHELTESIILKPSIINDSEYLFLDININKPVNDTKYSLKKLYNILNSYNCLFSLEILTEENKTLFECKICLDFENYWIIFLNEIQNTEEEPETNKPENNKQETLINSIEKEKNIESNTTTTKPNDEKPKEEPETKKVNPNELVTIPNVTRKERLNNSKIFSKNENITTPSSKKQDINEENINNTSENINNTSLPSNNKKGKKKIIIIIIIGSIISVCVVSSIIYFIY